MTRLVHIGLLAAAFIWTYGSAYECREPNESYNICGQLCVGTCEAPYIDPKYCPRIVCVHNFTGGCRCDEGYVRHHASGACLRVEDCPNE